MAKKRHKPIMPHETQKTVAWYVKTYPLMVLERQAIIDGSPVPPEVASRTNLPGDPVCSKVEKLEAITARLDAIEYARDCIPVEYRRAVWNNALMGSPFPDTADPETWRAYKNDFLFIVAWGLGLPLVR